MLDATLVITWSFSWRRGLHTLRCKASSAHTIYWANIEEYHPHVVKRLRKVHFARLTYEGNAYLLFHFLALSRSSKPVHQTQKKGAWLACTCRNKSIPIWNRRTRGDMKARSGSYIGYSAFLSLSHFPWLWCQNECFLQREIRAFSQKELNKMHFFY